ncbi:hypothetical protein HPB47_016098 [Ixodes persulcatus]|uniref:Uncharacterized protein n=1 Tax=Ixodes persulcatus TaxID=34615 RepID=A0AC60QSZ5_IXOPE|nr:hypothetical protein HPB47_016098 [Ixodes persulcatus]
MTLSSLFSGVSCRRARAAFLGAGQSAKVVGASEEASSRAPAEYSVKETSGDSEQRRCARGSRPSGRGPCRAQPRRAGSCCGLRDPAQVPSAPPFSNFRGQVGNKFAKTDNELTPPG